MRRNGSSTTVSSISTSSTSHLICNEGSVPSSPRTWTMQSTPDWPWTLTSKAASRSDATTAAAAAEMGSPSPAGTGRRDPSPFVDRLGSNSPLARESGSHLHSNLNLREQYLRGLLGDAAVDGVYAAAGDGDDDNDDDDDDDTEAVALNKHRKDFSHRHENEDLERNIF